MFSDELLKAFRRRPYAEVQDIVKYCYQAAFGQGHLLSSEALSYLEAESKDLVWRSEILTEAVGDHFTRVNLHPWLKVSLPLPYLYALMTFPYERQSDEAFLSYLKSAVKTLPELGFPREELEKGIDEYLKGGIRAVHHSEEYRSAEAPAYRIIGNEAAGAIPVLEALRPEDRIIAIDGRCASGKTTLAEVLSKMLNAPVIHLDDFFLPLELRSEERLSEPGGNVHYERFLEEVIAPLRDHDKISYRIFDCSSCDYISKAELPAYDYLIIEGSYSHHPYFRDYADIRVFKDIESAEQLRRLGIREDQESLERFRLRWIPMEEKYFHTFRIKEKADIII